MRYARNVDRNHAETVRVFRAMGCDVLDVSAQSLVSVDLIVSRGIRYALVEVKDGAKPPSARKLTPREAAFRDLCERVGLHWHLVECPEDAQELVNSWTRYVPAPEPVPLDEVLRASARGGR